MNIKDFKEEFDPLVSNFINTKISEVSKDSDLKFLKNYFDYLNRFISDGKKIRPYIAYLIYSSYGGKDKKEILNKKLIYKL